MLLTAWQVLCACTFRWSTQLAAHSTPIFTWSLDFSFASSLLSGESVWKTKFLEFRGVFGLRSDIAASFWRTALGLFKRDPLFIWRTKKCCVKPLTWAKVTSRLLLIENLLPTMQTRNDQNLGAADCCVLQMWFGNTILQNHHQPGHHWLVWMLQRGSWVTVLCLVPLLLGLLRETERKMLHSELHLKGCSFISNWKIDNRQ